LCCNCLVCLAFIKAHIVWFRVSGVVGFCVRLLQYAASLAPVAIKFIRMITALDVYLEY